MESRLDPTGRIRGNLITEDDLVVEGILEGTIRSTARVVVVAGARVKGRITAGEVEVLGIVEGDVRATGHLRLSATGRIEGDVRAAHLTVEDGGVLLGRVLSDTGPTA